MSQESKPNPLDSIFGVAGSGGVIVFAVVVSLAVTVGIFVAAGWLLVQFCRLCGRYPKATLSLASLGLLVGGLLLFQTTREAEERRVQEEVRARQVAAAAEAAAAAARPAELARVPRSDQGIDVHNPLHPGVYPLREMSSGKHITDDGEFVYVNGKGGRVLFADRRYTRADDEGLDAENPVVPGVYPLLEMSTGKRIVEDRTPVYVDDDGNGIEFVDTSLVLASDQGLATQSSPYPGLHLLTEMSTGKYLTDNNIPLIADAEGRPVEFIDISKVNTDDQGMQSDQPAYTGVYALREMSSGKYVTEAGQPVYVDTNGARLVEIVQADEDNVGVDWQSPVTPGMYPLKELSSGKTIVDKMRPVYVDEHGQRVDTDTFSSDDT